MARRSRRWRRGSPAALGAAHFLVVGGGLTAAQAAIAAVAAGARVVLRRGGR